MVRSYLTRVPGAPGLLAFFFLAGACTSGGGDGFSGVPTSTGASSTAADTDSSTSGGTTATSGGTSETSDSGGSSGGGGSFIEEPDGGSINECDVWAQDCPAGEKCMPWASSGQNFWDALRCAPVDPNPKQPGDECIAEGGGLSGVDDCALGSMCWNVSGETGTGVCVELCGGSPDTPMCSDPATVCSIAHDGVLPLCLTACDPVVQDCPVDGESCVLTADGGFKCEPNQAGTGGNYGDPCEFTNVCQEGLFCLSGTLVAGCEDPYCCTAFCDATDPNATDTCPGKDLGDQCVDWYEAGQAPPGMDHVGFCGLPP